MDASTDALLCARCLREAPDGIGFDEEGILHRIPNDWTELPTDGYPAYVEIVCPGCLTGLDKARLGVE